MLPVKIILYLSFVIGLWQCQPAVQKPTPPLFQVIPIADIETTTPLDSAEHLNNYKKLKAQIHQAKSNITSNSANDSEKIKAAKSLLSEMLVDSIFQYWYETPWDFNGHTNQPRNGEIACGYFVTTTLKHLGFPINRYKIAQQAASIIVEKLCAAESIRQFNNLNALTQYVDQSEDNSIFILGLDYHVGFVIKTASQHFFIHSNYIGRKGVEKEILQNSSAIHSSNIYFIGNVTSNATLLGKWLQNSQL